MNEDFVGRKLVVHVGTTQTKREREKKCDALLDELNTIDFLDRIMGDYGKEERDRRKARIHEILARETEANR